MKMKNDHRSKFSNLSNWKEEAWKKSGLQRDSNPWLSNQKPWLQSKQVKRTPQDSINELIIWKMNPVVVPVTSVKFKSELLYA